MKISKIYVKNNNTQYSIYIGTGALNILRKQIKKLCPKTKKIGLILDKNITEIGYFAEGKGSIHITNCDNDKLWRKNKSFNHY